MAKHSGKILDSVKDYKVIDCKKCGFRHLMPIPTKEDLRKIYDSDYYSREKPLYIKRNLEDELWWQSVYKDRLETIEKFNNHKNGRLIELGSGPGLFLKFARKVGWDAIGVEISKKAVNFCRKNKIPVIESSFEELDIAKIGLFDTAVMFEVLEHVADPTSVLRLAKSLLKEKGIICISVPNDYNPFQEVARKALKIDRWWVAPPFHINYFSTLSISKWLKKNGFRVLYKETSFPMEIFLLMGHNYIGNNKLGRKMHGERKLFDMSFSKANNSLKRTFYETLANLNIGRSVIIYGQKI
jgi:SAM-dependent methyltransferase